MKKMSGIPEADAFVRRNVTYVEMEDIIGHLAPLLRCIDGRRPKKPNQLGSRIDEADEPEGFISFPGGSIGVVAQILCAINALIKTWDGAKDPRATSARERFNFSRVMNCLERCLGGMSCHTDDHAVGKPLACSGCGHAMALLGGGYGLGQTYRAAMRRYMKDLKRRALAGEKGIVVDVYDGSHVESGVLRIISELSIGQFASIPPTDGEMSVFVFNERMALFVLTKITGLMYEEFRTDFKDHGVSKEELTAMVISFFFTHTRSSAFKLAHDLPVYDVLHASSKQVEVRKSDLRY